MNFLIKRKPALILIDIQKGFDDIEFWGGGRNNPKAEKNASHLLKYWRQNKLAVFHVKHCSTNPDSRLAEGKSGNEIQDIVKPLTTEALIKKSVNSAFIGTDLLDQLKALNIQTLVFVGLTTDHCVSTSVRMAGNLGFETYVVNDATATFDKIDFNGIKHPAQLIHDTALASLNKEFATVVNTAEILKSTH
jgi:nicotinamidase-related amidase